MNECEQLNERMNMNKKSLLCVLANSWINAEGTSYKYENVNEVHGSMVHRNSYKFVKYRLHLSYDNGTAAGFLKYVETCRLLSLRELICTSARLLRTMAAKHFSLRKLLSTSCRNTSWLSRDAKWYLLRNIIVCYVLVVLATLLFFLYCYLNGVGKLNDDADMNLITTDMSMDLKLSHA